MKRALFLFVFILITGKAISQEYNPSLESQLGKYFHATQEKDWETVLALVNPKIFDFAPKEMLKQMYSQMDRDSGIQLTFSDHQVHGLLEELWMSDTSYIPVDYSAILRIRVNPKIFKSQEDIQQLKESFEKTYYGQEVYFDSVTSEFYVGIRSTLIASSAKNSKEWFFSEYRANDPLFRRIVPNEVISRLHRGWNE